MYVTITNRTVLHVHSYTRRDDRTSESRGHSTCICMHVHVFCAHVGMSSSVCVCEYVCNTIFIMCMYVHTSIHGHKCTLFAHLFICVSFSVLSDSRLWFPIISRLAWVPNRGYINSCVLSMQIDYKEVADDGKGTDDAHKVHTQIPKHRLHCKGPCSLLQLCAIFQGSKTFQE